LEKKLEKKYNSKTIIFNITNTIVGLFLLSCASLSSDIQKVKHNSINKNSKSFQFRVIASEDHKELIGNVKEELIKKGLVIDSNSKFILELVIEEMDSGSGLLRFVNVLLTMATRTFIPYYNRVDYKLTYRVYELNELKSSSVFHLSNKEFFGILLLPLSPFLWPRTTEEKLFLESTNLLLD
jgi:hypothetical protein